MKNVVRQHWETKLEAIDKTKSKEVAAVIDAHLNNLTPLVDQLDYEIFCIPNIVSHSKHITKDELSVYLRYIESLAMGYSSTLGKELTSLVLIGLTSKARNMASAQKYYTTLSEAIDAQAKVYESKIGKRKRRVVVISSRMQKYNSSLLRLFRQGKIKALGRKLNLTTREIEALTLKLQTFSNIKASMKERAAPSPHVPPSPPSKP